MEIIDKDTYDLDIYDAKVTCPWCERSVNVGEVWEQLSGLDDTVIEDTQCPECEKYFKFQVDIYVNYSVDYLNTERS